MIRPTWSVTTLAEAASAAPPLSAEDVERVAKLAALPVQPTHATDLAAVLTFVAHVQAVDTAGVAPAVRPFPAEVRADGAPAAGQQAPREGADGGVEHLSTDALLANTKHRQGPYFAVYTGGRPGAAAVSEAKVDREDVA